MARSNQETESGKNVSPCLTQKAPYKGLCADSGEKHEPASDIDAAPVDGLTALDPTRPIREADSCTAANSTFDDAVGIGRAQFSRDATVSVLLMHVLAACRSVSGICRLR